ncbi:MAG TPA: hypothetical protein VHY20_04725 [Pirellulales bacterium]|jgi:hypothetical protein|nr:hypothetical protein [Pirellulales bacterium]
MIEPTLNSRLSSAELCRRNGWGRGTVLKAARLPKEGPGADQAIVLTAVGERMVLAIDLVNDEEQAWNLATRDWRRT